MKKLLLVIGFYLVLPSMVHADSIFGVYAGVRMWHQDYGGDFQLLTIDTDFPVDVDDDVELDNDTNPTFFVAIEHPIPLLPNFKLQRTEIKTTQNIKVGLSFDYTGHTFSTGFEVETELDIGYWAAIFYYEVLDNWVTLDLGLAIAEFDSEFTIEDKTNLYVASTPIEETVPLLYGKAEFQLPFTGLSAGAELALINYDGNEVREFHSYLLYELGYGLSATLGYEQSTIRLDGLRVNVNTARGRSTSPLDADVDVRGPYLGLVYHF